MGARLRVGKMKLYRINKVSQPGGPVLAKKDILATTDKEAIRTAAESTECPVCEVLKDGQYVGLIV